MLLPKFDYHAPASLEETCALLREFGPRAKLLAGGTDLLVNMKKKALAPEQVVSLDRVPGLDQVLTDKNRVTLGAGCRASRLAESRAVKKNLHLLAQAAGNLGSPLIRNRATLGGNLVTARPASDLAPPLMALDARVVLTSADGERQVPLDEFFLGPGQTLIRPEEVLTSVVIPRPKPGSGGGYFKLGLRRTLEIALVNAAAFITLDPGGRKIETARVVLGAVAPRPIRSAAAEKILAGAAPSAKILTQAARAAAGDARAITDHRGSAEYRRQMVEVLTRRALQAAWAEAGA